MSNNHIKFPLDFKTGLGYSPNSGPPQGGWPKLPGSNFYGQPLNSLLPNGSTPTSNMHFFGGHKRKRFPKQVIIMNCNNKSKGKRHKFGYPLMNQPSSSLNLQMFPRYPVGTGNTPGGSGGVFLQGMPTTNQYWGFGRRRRSRKSKRKSRKSRRSRRRSRRSRRRSRRSRRRHHFG